MDIRFRLAVWLFLSPLGLSCDGEAPPAPRVEQDSDLAVLQEAVRWPDRAPNVVTTLASIYTATGRSRDGFDFFGELVEEEPDNGIFLAVRAQMRAQMSSEIALVRRVRWVETAIAELDQAVALDDDLPRYVRALVLAALPARFGEMDRAVDEIEFLLESPDSFVQGDEINETTRITLVRSALQALGRVHETRGDRAASDEAWARAGGRPTSGPTVVSGFSVGAAAGFRFAPEQFYRPSSTVHVAQGFDFGDIVFIETSEGLVVVDAGTTNDNASAAIQALRASGVDAPVHTMVLTHAHWDHIGGVDALRAPTTRVIGQANFAEELAIVNGATRSTGWFFGTDHTGGRSPDEPLFTVMPDMLVEEPTTVVVGGREFRLIPVRGGETEDALLIHLVDDNLVFVGDAFMPYLGAPFVGEGDPEELLNVIDLLLEIAPRELIHGHPPLTDLYTIEIMPSFREALAELREAVLLGIRDNDPIVEIVARTPLPDVLRGDPDAVLPTYVMRQTFMQRLHRKRTGYWQANLTGVELIRDEAWASALDLLAGGSAERWENAIASLVDRGDFSVAWRLSESAVLQYPDRAVLQELRQAALHGLRERYAATNPFKLIVFSELAGVEVPPNPPHR
ncbi:MAG: MBL fold metallo-hydrolase [Myxococcota bacterium]